MKKIILFIGLLLIAAVTINARQSDFPKLTGAHPGQKPSGKTPEIFAQGAVSLLDNSDFSGPFSPDGNAANAQSFDPLKAELEKCLNENEIPGAAVAVVTRNAVLFMAGFGYANLEKKIPVSVNTHFWLGSISKSFTALGLVKLAEEGRLDLNMPLKEILPDLDLDNPWEKTDPLRLVHLLEHTAGLCDGAALSGFWNWQHDPNIPLGEAIHLYKPIKVYHQPGSFFLYSNVGYLLAGAVIEKVAHTKYEEYLKQAFLLPLEMKTTTFYQQDPYSRSVLAQGYGAEGKAIPFLYMYVRPAGSSYSSVLEMAQYVRFYLNDGTYNGVQILKPESLRRMETPQTSLASRTRLSNGYGLGSEWAIRNQHKWRGHNGAGFGNYSDFWYNRDLNIGFVVLINQFDFRSRPNVRKLREVVAKYLTQNCEPVFQPIIAVPKERLNGFCGTYVDGYGRKDFLGLINFVMGMTEVQLAGDALSLRQPLGGYRETVFPVSAGLFRDKDSPDATVAFFTTPEGSKAMVKGQDFSEEFYPWKYWTTVAFIFWSVLIMLSVVVVAFLWAFIYAFKRIRRKQIIIHWLPVKICLFSATLALIAGFILITNQGIHVWGKPTSTNIAFYVLTWLFAALSVASFVCAVMCFKKPLGKISRVYHVVASCTYAAWAIFLWYWGVVGLKLWL